MKKISLKGISEILSEKELKNVVGGSGSGSSGCKYCSKQSDCGSTQMCGTITGKCDGAKFCF